MSQAKIAAEFKVRVIIFARRHVEARGYPRHDRKDPAIVRPARHSREQCRHPACGAACRNSRRKSGTPSWRSTCRPPFIPRGWRCLRCSRNKWGRIINIASAHGLVASPFKSAYVAAKHGMVGLTKVTALETAEQGITCNAICPGYVYTPLVEAQIGARPRRTVFRASRSSATCCSRSSRTSVSPRSKSWARLPFSLQARPRLRSPAWRCRWMAAGPRIERIPEKPGDKFAPDEYRYSAQACDVARCGRKR